MGLGGGGSPPPTPHRGQRTCVLYPCKNIYQKKESRVVVRAITTHRDTQRIIVLCIMTAPKHAEGCRSFDHDTPGTRRESSFLRFDKAQTRRGLSFVRSRTPARVQRVIVFVSRQRPNTQRVVVRAITTPRTHAEGHRFRFSTTPEHAEGCRSCDRDTRRARRGSSFLRFDNAKTIRGLSFKFVRSRHASTQRVMSRFNNAQAP